MPNGRKVIFKIAIALALGASAAVAGPPPLIDARVWTVVLNGERYEIPGNFLPSGETKSGDITRVISLRALLPDIVGFTEETLECGSAVSKCSERAVTIGVENSPGVPGSQMLQNIQGLINPQKFTGPCGLEFYETTGNESQQFRYFFKTMSGERDLSILRCPKEESTYAPICVSANNPLDKISFYYNFNRKFVCDWEDIRNKVRSRIVSFRHEIAK
jgi:hypothetical protein